MRGMTQRRLSANGQRENHARLDAEHEARVKRVAERARQRAAHTPERARNLFAVHNPFECCRDAILDARAARRTDAHRDDW